MAIASLLIAAAALTSHSTGPTIMGPAPVFSPYKLPPPEDVIEQINYRHLEELKALHDEGLAVQRADGGSLTPAHHAELQAKLDRIQQAFRRDIDRASPWSVDSRGIRHQP